MAGAGTARTIRKNRPWRFRIKQWKDETGAVQDAADFTWLFAAATSPALGVAGVVDGDGVLFARSATETDALAAGRAEYAVTATPIAGGDAIYVLEGSVIVKRTSV